MEIGLSSYLTGITHLASSLSKNIGPSFIEADCFKKQKYKDDFSKYYEVPKEKIKVKETDKTIQDIFEIWLWKDSKLIDNMLYLINYELGSPSKVYEINKEVINALSRSDGGISSFYTAEEGYFIEFEKYMVCFTIGNNE